MNEWKKKCVGLQRTWVSKRTGICLNRHSALFETFIRQANFPYSDSSLSSLKWSALFLVVWFARADIRLFRYPPALFLDNENGFDVTRLRTCEHEAQTIHALHGLARIAVCVINGCLISEVELMHTLGSTWVRCSLFSQMMKQTDSACMMVDTMWWGAGASRFNNSGSLQLTTVAQLTTSSCCHFLKF